MKSKHQCGPARHIFIYWWGAESWREFRMFMSDLSAPLTPQKATLDIKRTLS
jgi:hypothetical protein